MLVYVVQKGDALDKIINKFVVPYKELQRLNPDVDFTRLKVGERICIRKDVEAIYYQDNNVALESSEETIICPHCHQTFKVKK